MKEEAWSNIMWSRLTRVNHIDIVQLEVSRRNSKRAACIVAAGRCCIGVVGDNSFVASVARGISRVSVYCELCTTRHDVDL